MKPTKDLHHMPHGPTHAQTGWKKSPPRGVWPTHRPHGEIMAKKRKPTELETPGDA